jgi:hypothetical protein
MQKDVAGRKEIKEKETGTGSGNSSTDSITY